MCCVVPPVGLYRVVDTGLLWCVSTLCGVEPPAGPYGVVGTSLLWDVSTLCAVVPPPGLYGVVGTGLLWGVSTLCGVEPPRGPYVSGHPPRPLCEQCSESSRSVPREVVAAERHHVLLRTRLLHQRLCTTMKKSGES